MRIDYNIIWFENDEGWLKPALRNLTTFLDDYGFRLREKVEKSGENLDVLISEINSKSRDVDIILMDYKLTGRENGDKLIKKIRKTELFTEIIFYSADNNVKNIIEQEHGSFEGVYYAGRDNFLQKSKEVIWHMIKKVEDVESMRGLIMGVVTEIDEVMIEIINDFYAKCRQDQKIKISAQIFSAVQQSVHEKSKKFEQLHPNLNLKKLIKDNLLFDADKKAIALQAIINEALHPELEHLLGEAFYKSYKTDIIKTRNNFAHVSVIFEDGIRKLKSNTNAEEFTDERCIEIRRSLIQHLDGINNVKTKLR